MGNDTCTDGTELTGTIADYFAVVRRTGAHASIEGLPIPSNNAIHRIVQAESDR